MNWNKYLLCFFNIYINIALFICRIALIIVRLFGKKIDYEYINNFVVWRKINDDKSSITIKYISKKCMLPLHSLFFTSDKMIKSVTISRNDKMNFNIDDIEHINKYFDIGNEDNEYLDEFINCLLCADENHMYKFVE